MPGWAVPLGLTALLISGSALARSETPEPRSYTLGLSYMGTGGNTRSRTFGGDFAFRFPSKPWGIEGSAGYLRGDQNGAPAAERFYAGLKGSRRLGGRWEVFLAGRWEKDRFAGYEARLGLSGGAMFKIPTSAKHKLLFEAGASWSRDRYVGGILDTHPGGLIQGRYTRIWTESSRLEHRLLWQPNFKDSANWHGESETSVIAGLTGQVALKGSFLVRYNNRPPAGYKKTDTTLALSLVMTL